MSQTSGMLRWRYRVRYRYRSFFLRLIGLLIILWSLTSHSGWAAWLALFPWLAIWLTAFARNRLFLRNLHGLPQLNASDPLPVREAWPKVTIISPGRNEQDAIEKSARSLAAIDYPNLEILLVNDHSTDRTGEILERLKPELPRVTVIDNPPVQAGWQGKANAIWHAVQKADANAEWLLLTDADAEFDPSAVKRGVDLAEREGLDFLTCVPYLLNESLAEELVVPMQWQSVVCATRYDKINHPNSLPVGLGPFILVRRRVYLGSGGHSAFPAEQPEDTLLAATVREWGGKMGVAWTSNAVRVRPYCGWKQVVRFAVRKNRISADDKAMTFASQIMLLLMVYVLPLPLGIAAIAKQIAAHDFSLGLTLGALLGIGTYFSMSRGLKETRAITQIRRGLEWFHPFFGLFRSYLEAASLWGAVLGKPLEWRGRSFVNVRTAK